MKGRVRVKKKLGAALKSEKDLRAVFLGEILWKLY
jgi:hypothetical protein